ncbi:ubiquitin-conjugating enzyme/RWD-like protein [Penicillium argentinense]|uniref:Ubiquitin-conjugating enzyme E2 2 n=1 Tax=Penicillium argentinense TaxID=1131581 RepID=A0A9W9FGH6_9EURO|nr:ubiquitin-conjugating enzyme/RWD-like protein [Penicillium argentinense]KAJ5099726.1 ubiquitin-conjugating enzyme/RWD-like protein [Penicillium argentinense]
MAERILMNEYRTLSKEKWVNIELKEDDIFSWDLALFVLNKDSLYYDGYLKATMTFPKNYPYSPPKFRFLVPLYHPNIYPNGDLCISILHPPGDDEMSGELASERWSPAQRVESVLISILSLLDDAEVSSPANVDAAVMLRKNPTEYRAIVKSNVEESRKLAPAGFTMPVDDDEPVMREVEKDDDDFWVESDVDSFGGSDSDSDLDMDQLSGSDADDDDDDDDSEDSCEQQQKA